MYPSISVWGKYRLPLYGVMFGIGYYLVILIGRKTAKDFAIKKNDVLYAAVYGLIGIGAGAKIFYFLSKLPQILTHFEAFCKLVQFNLLAACNYLFGGMVFYGGLLGAMLGIWIYCRQYNISFQNLLCVVVPLFPLAHGFGRTGCFLAGCCYGIPYEGIFAVHFPYNELSPELSVSPRFPVQLLEAFINFVLFIVLLSWNQKKKPDASQICGTYLLCYAISRFFLEFLRGDRIRGHIGLLSTSQWISLIVVPMGIWLLGAQKRKNKIHGGR